MYIYQFSYKCALAVVALLGASAIGCGSSGPQLEAVTGTITKDGVPFVGADLEFYPAGEGAASYGRSDENGNFALRYSTGRPGAVPGEHLVTVIGGSVDASKLPAVPSDNGVASEGEPLAPIGNPDAAKKSGGPGGPPKSIDGIPATVVLGEENHVLIEI